METTNNAYLVGFSYSTKEMPIISYNNVLLKVMMRKQHPKSGKTTIFQLRFDFPFRKSVIDYSKVMHCYYVMLCLIYFVSICCFCMWVCGSGPTDIIDIFVCVLILFYASLTQWESKKKRGRHMLYNTQLMMIGVDCC